MANSRTGNQLEILEFHTTYLAKSTPIPEFYKTYRKQLRKGVYNRMSWSEFYKRTPKNAVKVHLVSCAGRSQLASFLYNVGLDSFAAQCRFGLSTLRQALTEFSLELVNNNVYVQQEHILDFALKVYNNEFTGHEEFWTAVFHIGKCSYDSFQPPSSSPPPYALVGSPS